MGTQQSGTAMRAIQVLLSPKLLAILKGGRLFYWGEDDGGVDVDDLPVSKQ